MDNFISRILVRMLRKTTNRFASVRCQYGYRRFLKKKVEKNLPYELFPYKKYLKTENPFFAKWGLHYGVMEGEYYALSNGIRSYLYLPDSLWYQFILTYLNRLSWDWAYTDKNMFNRLMDMPNLSKELDVSFPENVVYNINGSNFIGGRRKPVSFEECLDVIIAYPDDLILKPTVESDGGKGIKRLGTAEKQKGKLTEILSQYRSNYAVQKMVQQHNDLASFNPTSLNTIRILTYMDFNGKVKVLKAVQRFGGKDSVMDNASSGGGFVGINPDGSYMRDYHKIGKVSTEKLDDNVACKVPCWEKIKYTVSEMHYQLPQFGLIGWDVSVCPNEHIVVVEYNFHVGDTIVQQSVGPIFDEKDLSEILDHVCKAKLELQVGVKVSYSEKPGYSVTRYV